MGATFFPYIFILLKRESVWEVNLIEVLQQEKENWAVGSRSAVAGVVIPGQQRQHHLGTCSRCQRSAPPQTS